MHTSQKLLRQQQKHIAHHAQKTNAYTFFNILTSPQLLDVVEQHLPPHRERLYTPTTTLSLFTCAGDEYGRILSEHGESPCR